jgi:hypothetical protein
MNVLLPKLLIETLRKRTKGKLGSGERRCSRITAQRGRSAREEERAALATLIIFLNGLAAERVDRLARERKGSLDVRVCNPVDFFLGDLQEGLPDGEACVEERDAYVRLGPVRACGAEGGLDFFVVVVGYWESRCLDWA